MARLANASLPRCLLTTGVRFGHPTDLGRSTERRYGRETEARHRGWLRDRGPAARGLHLQRPLPVLGRRGPRLQDLRHDDRLGHREGLDRGRRRRRPDDRGLGPHPRATSSTPKSWKAVVFVDERATRRAAGRRCSSSSPASSAARVADLAGLDRRGRRGRARADHVHRRGRQGPARRSATIVDADMAPFVGATGNPTTLAETVFSTIPGSPVYASKASHVHARRQRRTASRASTSRATTPSRATSASRPEPQTGATRCSRAAHLRDPRRDRAILGGVARRARGDRLARALALWSASPYGRYLHHDGAASRRQPGRGGAVRRSAGS